MCNFVGNPSDFASSDEFDDLIFAALRNDEKEEIKHEKKDFNGFQIKNQKYDKVRRSIRQIQPRYQRC